MLKKPQRSKKAGHVNGRVTKSGKGQLLTSKVELGRELPPGREPELWHHKCVLVPRSPRAPEVAPELREFLELHRVGQAKIEDAMVFFGTCGWTRYKNLQFIRSYGNRLPPKPVERVLDCSQYLHVVVTQDGNVAYQRQYPCNNPDLCVSCAGEANVRLHRKAYSKVLAVMKANPALHLSLVTLSLPPGGSLTEGHLLLRELLRKIWQYGKQCRSRSRLRYTAFSNVVATWEAIDLKYLGKAPKLHVHMVVLSLTPLRLSMLHSTWLHLVRDSGRRARRCDDLVHVVSDKFGEPGDCHPDPWDVAEHAAKFIAYGARRNTESKGRRRANEFVALRARLGGTFSRALRKTTTRGLLRGPVRKYEP